MLHVRSFSVRQKRRNLETANSFRRNLQRRKLGVTLSNASTASGATVISENAAKKTATLGRPRSCSLTVEGVGGKKKAKDEEQSPRPLSSPLSDRAKLVLLRSLTTADQVQSAAASKVGRQVKFTLQSDGVR